ncbi:MAG TPA: response regulator, partial [Myxococcota bacterium]|nr:response regulator [Myxococcota bacterium]
ATHLVDGELRVIAISKSFEEWGARLGIDIAPTAALGRPLAELFPFLPAEVFAQYRQVLDTGRPLQTLELTQLGEREIATRTRKLPVKGPGGQDWVLTIVTDVTGQQGAEEAVRSSELRYRQLFEATTDAILVADAGTHRLLDCNLAAERLLGRSRAEILAMRADELHPPEVLEHTMRRFGNYARGMLDSGLDSELVTRTGGRVPVSINAGRVQLGDRFCVIGIFRDNTERRRAEEERGRLLEQLQQSMKMEAIGRLAGGVAHDFNNLLTSIAGNLELALLDLDPADSVARSLTESRRACESAAELTRRLLAFSRKQVIAPRPLDLGELVAHLQPMLARLLGEDIRLLVVQGSALAPVKVDPGQFEQILANLAINARDAMPDGGTLRIETANLAVDAATCARHPGLRPGPHVRLAVSDTGQGRSDEVKAHLFEPFFTTKPMGRGTGLGLASIYGAVHQAGGAIEVESAPGQGATFRLLLPVTAEPAERLAPESLGRLPLPGGRETVLVVEDEASVRALALEILGRLGYRVLSAQDGQEALRLAGQSEEPIDLLVTDVVMPGMNGRELAERLQRLHPETRVLYTSGYSEEVIAHRGVVEEQLNFLSKPYTPRSLADKLREVLAAPVHTDIHGGG